MAKLIDLIHIAQREEDQDAMIAAYVPEADYLSRTEALELAEQRDRFAAEQLHIDVTGLNLEQAAKVATVGVKDKKIYPCPVE